MRAATSRRVLVVLPFVAGFGNLVFFALLVGRSEHRFLLPFGFFLSAYGGIACDALLERMTTPRMRRALLGVFGWGFAWAGLESFAVHLTQLGDARRDVVRYLARLTPGSSVETYGLTVYQPHFDVSPGAPYRVRRVGPERPGARNPLVGAEEFQGVIGDAVAREPDVIVLSDGFANAYFEKEVRAGASTPGVVRARQRDRATVRIRPSGRRERARWLPAGARRPGDDPHLGDNARPSPGSHSVDHRFDALGARAGRDSEQGRASTECTPSEHGVPVTLYERLLRSTRTVCSSNHYRHTP